MMRTITQRYRTRPGSFRRIVASRSCALRTAYIHLMQPTLVSRSSMASLTNRSFLPPLTITVLYLSSYHYLRLIKHARVSKKKTKKKKNKTKNRYGEYVHASSDTTVWRWRYVGGQRTDSTGTREVVVKNMNADGRGGAPQVTPRARSRSTPREVGRLSRKLR